VSGYNIVIPDVCRQHAPEVTLPVMDALQALGHTPVTLAMLSINDMYQQMRYQRHGCYEIFQFYVQDLLRKGRIDFGFSVGLSIVLEDPAKAEAHHLLEECGIPNIIYLHSRELDLAAKLDEIRAYEWQHTYIACTSSELMEVLAGGGLQHVLETWPGTCFRVFYPAEDPAVDAAYPLQVDDERLTEGFDASFVGAWSPIRETYISALRASGVPTAVFGDLAWQDSSVRDCWRGRAQYLTEVNTVYNSSKIILDLPHDDCQFKNYISSRVFDCLATRSCLATYRRPALERVLDPAREVITYDDNHQLAKAAEYYLEHEDERLAIAQRGFSRAINDHSWARRLSSLMPGLEMHLLTLTTA
jgi:hypothetical protein